MKRAGLEEHEAEHLERAAVRWAKPQHNDHDDNPIGALIFAAPLAVLLWIAVLASAGVI